MTSSEKKLFLTGASGLLGRAIFKKFSERGWKVYGIGLSRVSSPLIKLDLHDTSAVHKAVEDFRPCFIIHSAALRFPDKVELNPEEAVRMNVEVTKQLTSIADAFEVPMLYISTDYVFDGKNSPYKVEDFTNPLNLYGKTKLEGERETLNVNKGNMVLRIPVLYGPVENLSESAVTTALEPLLNITKPCNMSNYERRYPAHVDDVADICFHLAEKKLEDSSISGIFQWSGKEVLTKYQMVCRIASLFNIPTSHVTPVNNPGSGGASRPYDTEMDVSRLVDVLSTIPRHTPFDEGIKSCLRPWIEGRNN